MAKKKVEEMTADEINDFLSEDTEDVTQLAMQKEELIKQRDEANSTLEGLKEQVSTLEKQIQEKADEYSATLEEANSKIEEATQKIAGAEATVAEAEAENKTLLDENQELHAKLHKTLVERVVDVKVALGKPGAENREEAVEAHMDRTDESLSDSLVDLLSELTDRTTNVAAIMASAKPLVKEGLANTNEKNSTLVDEVGNEQMMDNSITDYDAVKNLFTRKFN